MAFKGTKFNHYHETLTEYRERIDRQNKIEMLRDAARQLKQIKHDKNEKNVARNQRN